MEIGSNHDLCVCKVTSKILGCLLTSNFCDDSRPVKLSVQNNQKCSKVGFAVESKTKENLPRNQAILLVKRFVVLDPRSLFSRAWVQGMRKEWSGTSVASLSC